MKFPPLLAAAILLGSSGLAQAASWTIDPAKSSLGFSGKQGGELFKGAFGKFVGTIEFDPAAPESGHAAVTIDLASAKTGDAQRDAALPQPEWFDVKASPQASFAVKSFKAMGGDKFEAVGSLTIRGVAKDLSVPFTLAIAGDTARAKGHVELIRTNFGVGQGPWSSADIVALEVGVDLEITAVKAP